MVLLTDGPAQSLHQAFNQRVLLRPVTKHQARLTPDHADAVMETLLDITQALPRGPVHIDLTATNAAARALLAVSRKPLIIAGMEARYDGAAPALDAFARQLGAPVLLTYKAKGCLAADDARMVGLFTNAASELEVLEHADLLILYGLDPVEMIPGDWRCQATVLDLFPGPKPAGIITADVTLTAPLAEALKSLRSGIAEPVWQADEIAALKAGARARVSMTGKGHTAASVVQALAGISPEGCRLTVDAGAHMFAAMNLWPASQPNDVLKSNGLSTMGYALPVAIASALEDRTRPVAALTGDGGLMMCLAELATAVEHGLKVVTVVCNDAALSLIDIKQQRNQHPSRGVRYAAVDFATAAQAFGCPSWQVGSREPLEPALEAAFAQPGPALVDVCVDPSGYGEQLAALRG